MGGGGGVIGSNLFFARISSPAQGEMFFQNMKIFLKFLRFRPSGVLGFLMKIEGFWLKIGGDEF